MPTKLYYIPHEKRGTTAQSESRSKHFARLLPVSPSREPQRKESRDQEDEGSRLIGLVGGRPAGLQHLLHQVEADARLALVLGDGEVVEQVEVAHVGAVRVAVLVHQPLPLGGVGVPRADVLGLQVL